MSRPVSARRRAAAATGAAALALVLAGCADGGQQPAPTATPASTAPTATPEDPAASASVAATNPASQAAQRIDEAMASQRADGTERPTPREAFETVGPGIRRGAATPVWQQIVSGRTNSVSVMDCTSDVLDQTTLDAVATHIPNGGGMEIVELMASADSEHEFLNCSYNALGEVVPGMPLVEVKYQHNLNDERLDWCESDPAAVADEYTFDEETGKGLMALLRPGMVGGRDGAPLLPQRTGWACSEDGTQMVSVTFGAMEGFGDANEGLSQVTDSPVAGSTTLVTETRDHLADTVLRDPSGFQEVIQMSSPFFLDAQMDEETLQAAQEIGTGVLPADQLTNQSTIDRPEGAPEPVAPGQPPRPFQGAAREAAESSRAAEASASAASASASASGGSPSGSPSPADSSSPSPSPQD